MCDWPVWDGYYRDQPARPCGNNGHYPLGRLGICSRHFEMLTRDLLSELRREAKEWEAIGHSSHAPLEGQVRAELRRLDIERALAMGSPADETEADLRPEWVYFAEREGFVKIGTSRNVEQRLRQIAAGGQMPDGMTIGPVRLLAKTPGGRDSERFFHRKFDHLRVDPRREWFLLDEEIRIFVEGLKGAVSA